MAEGFRWQAPYEAWEKFVQELCAQEGWRIKMIDIDNLRGDFYYIKPLTAFERFTNKPPNEEIVVHADMDPDEEGFPVKLSKRKKS